MARTLATARTVIRDFTTGCVAFWNLEEIAGASRFDPIGGNTLASTNTVGQALGKTGFAAQFNSASVRSLSIADNAALSMGDIDFTLSCWVYFDSLAADQYIVSKWRQTGNLREYAIRYSQSANFLQFVCSATGSAVSVSRNFTTLGAPSTGTWYHLVAWHDSVNNTVNVSGNGGATDSTSYSSGVVDSTAAFRLGARDDAADFTDGRIDAVGVWKRVLTSAERTALYNSGNGLQWSW